MLKVSFPNAFAADVVTCDLLVVHGGAGCMCWTVPSEGPDLDQYTSVSPEADAAFPSGLPLHAAVADASPGDAPDWGSSTPPIRRAVINNLLEAVT